METRDQWYKPNLLYNIHYRPPKKVEPPKMIIETTRFNPSFCTCGEHGCEPRYRMESRVLWTNKEIVPNEKTQNRKDIHQVKYAEEVQETSKNGQNIDGSVRKFEDDISRNEEAKDVKDGEKKDSDKSEGKGSVVDTRSHIDDNSEKGDNRDGNSPWKSLKDSDSDGSEFEAKIDEKDKYDNDTEGNYVNFGGGGPNEKYNRDIDGNKDSLDTRKNGKEENGIVKGKECIGETDDYRCDDNDEKIYTYDKESNGKGVVGVRADSEGVVDEVNHEFPVDSIVDSFINESYLRNEDSGASARRNIIYDSRNKLTGFRDDTSKKNDRRRHRRYDCNGVIDGGERYVIADDVSENGVVEDANDKYFDEESNGEKSDDDATDIVKESNSDDASNRNNESDGEIVTSEVGTDDETAEQTLQGDDCYMQGDEISPVFGIMSIYCNSELHSWTMSDEECEEDGVLDTST